MDKGPISEHCLSGFFVILDQEKNNKDLCFEEFIIMGGSVYRHGSYIMGSGLAANRFL